MDVAAREYLSQIVSCVSDEALEMERTAVEAVSMSEAEREAHRDIATSILASAASAWLWLMLPEMFQLTTEPKLSLAERTEVERRNRQYERFRQ